MGGVAKYHSAEKYVFLLLLFTAAPVNQVFTLLMVAVTFFAGLAVAVKYRKLKRVPVLPRVQQGLLYLLLAITWYSLRFSADSAVSAYNFGYVVGQYVLLVWLVLRPANGRALCCFCLYFCCQALPTACLAFTSILPALCLPTLG